jgi:hypothetical protein
MVMGSFLRYMLCSVLMVTVLRRFMGEEPRGECELHRTCSGYDRDGDGAIRHSCDRVRSVLMRARDMVESAKNVVQVLWLRKLVVAKVGGRQGSAG